MRGIFQTGVVVAALCAGCVPYKLQQLPEVSGRVVDAATGNPIVNARIYFDVEDVEFYCSAADGNYYISARKRWRMVPLAPIDPMGIWLVVEADGYRQAKKMLNPRESPSTLEFRLERS